MGTQKLLIPDRMTLRNRQVAERHTGVGAHDDDAGRKGQNRRLNHRRAM